MDPNLDARLKAIEKTLDENNHLLRKMRRNQQIATATKLLYWAVLIILGIVSVSFIKPYLTQLGEAYGIGGGDTKSTTDYSDLLKTLKE